MRLEVWLADRRIRLAHSWGAFSHGYRVRKRRLAERFWARRTRLAEGYWIRRYRFRYRSGGLRERFVDWYWARWGRARRWAGRHGSAPRATLVAASLFVVLTVAVGVGIRALVATTPDPTETYPPAPIIGAAPALDVPDVRGMSALQARAELERSGLRFLRAIAAEGAPGRVLGTQPSTGRSVPPDTPVAVIVGVESERLVAGLVSSLSSEDSSAFP